jgi:hypothetical protein
MFRLNFHQEDYIYTAENLQRIDSLTKLSISNVQIIVKIYNVIRWQLSRNM